MEWRCTWCGKPHAADDPPCDNCGHHEFERAIEQVNTETVPSDPVWACTECGREHQRHSPPCSRCGNHTLEKRQPDYSDLEDIGGTSYLDVLEPKYAVGYAIIGAFGVILLLGLAGVISLPTLGGPPALPDAPGHSEEVGTLSLSAVASEYVDEVNQRRKIAGEDPLERRDGLDRFATYVNRVGVNADEQGVTMPSRKEIGEAYPLECAGTDLLPLYAHYTVGTSDDPAVDDSGDTAPDVIAETLVDDAPLRPAGWLEANFVTDVGVDVHVLDGRAHITVAVCADKLPNQ